MATKWRGDPSAGVCCRIARINGGGDRGLHNPDWAKPLGDNRALDHRLDTPVWQSPFSSFKTLQAYPGLLGAPSVTDTFQGTRAVAEDGTLPFSNITISDTGVADGDPAESQPASLSIAAGTLTLTSTTG